MKLIFIRHGATKGNAEHRYIGTTDEPLSESGREKLKSIKYPDCEKILVSPMKRCIQTAEILFPDKDFQTVEDFRECNFGDFEGKNYHELSGSPNYQKWIDSNGTETFPNGENPSEFRIRCVNAFLENLPSCESAAYVVHGGTIMAILSEFAGGEYFDYQTANGGGYSAVWHENRLKNVEVL